jgi:RHS repeat-associated protein
MTPSGVSKSAGGITIYYYFGVAEKENGVWTRLQVGGPTGKLAEYRGGTVYFYAANHLGSVAAVMDRNGTVAEQLRFYPFGERRLGSGGKRRQFTGQERDGESGNDYFGARYYWSGAGRWLGADPVLGDLYNPQRLNRYAYVLNDPVNYIDRGGRDEIPAGEMPQWFLAVQVHQYLPPPAFDYASYYLSFYWSFNYNGPGAPPPDYDWKRPEPPTFSDRARDALNRAIDEIGPGCQKFFSEKIGEDWATKMREHGRKTVFYDSRNLGEMRDLLNKWEAMTKYGDVHGMVVRGPDGGHLPLAVIKGDLTDWYFKAAVFGEQLHITTQLGDVEMMNQWEVWKLYSGRELRETETTFASDKLHRFINNDCAKHDAPRARR